jgi:hypothetical protein
VVAVVVAIAADPPAVGADAVVNGSISSKTGSSWE